MENLKKRLDKLQADIAAAIAKINLEELQTEQAKLHDEIARNDWADNLRAQAIRRQEAQLSARIVPWQNLRQSLEDLIGLAKMDDTSILADLEKQTIEVEDSFDALKKELQLGGPYDEHEVVLSIYAGAGGTDAQDWAQMLLRMYSRWADTHNLKVQTIEQSAGEEAGIKSATLKITGGNFLYGKLAGENGVHRLVRLSPFNADAKRQTSFAKVDVLPLIDEPADLEIDEKDIKVDVFRSGGAGGQSVNTTDSAVRVTHTPTGISVAIQNERSQLQNKETALAILRSRLAALQLEQHAETIKQVKGPNQSAEWGNQIRSYVLHPYKQVKDLRTGYETTDPQKVLDGEIDHLIDAWLDSLAS